MQTRKLSYILAATVLAAIIAHGYLVYFVDVTQLRLSLAWLTLTPIVLGGARLGVAEHTLRLVNPARYPRRFVRLRGRVEELLGEIRRLNWIALDARRGVREQGEAVEMMDAIEERLIALIGEIRASAGVERPLVTSAEASPTPAPPWVEVGAPEIAQSPSMSGSTT